MSECFKFVRLELSGSLGDLGALLPIAIATAMSPDQILASSLLMGVFVATLILGITLSSNLAAGFIAGMIVAQILKWEKLSV
jgi:fructose-specific phosphotransferase system IIC component